MNAASTYSLGVPAMVQTQFMIEGALVSILPSAYPRFQQILCNLDAVEAQYICGVEMVDFSSLEGITMDEKRGKKVMEIYQYLRASLANLMGIAPNPFDQRPMVSPRSLNVTVR